jgi:hypothetical protein
MALRGYLKKVRSQGAKIDKEVLEAAKSVIKQDCLNEEGWLEGADGERAPADDTTEIKGRTNKPKGPKKYWRQLRSSIDDMIDNIYETP